MSAETIPTTTAASNDFLSYAPAVYVGTYGKYNNGNLGGRWVNLDLWAGDRDGFLAHCAEIHSDESDPEIMFQDFQNFPREFYGESNLSEALFAWLELDDNDRELLARYQDAVGDRDATIEDAREHYSGTYDSGADAAEQMAEDCGYVSKDLPTWIVIDWEATWNRNLRHDYSTSEHDGKIWLFHH
jgi:antirestriction protein